MRQVIRRFLKHLEEGVRAWILYFTECIGGQDPLLMDFRGRYAGRWGAGFDASTISPFENSQKVKMNGGTRARPLILDSLAPLLFFLDS